jgi:hypothetical protein
MSVDQPAAIRSRMRPFIAKGQFIAEGQLIAEGQSGLFAAATSKNACLANPGQKYNAGFILLPLSSF